MASNAEKAVEIFKQHVGKEDQPGEWFLVDQQLSSSTWIPSAPRSSRRTR
jgi:hypothetical protein